MMDERLEKILPRYEGKYFELIPVLQEVQQEFGYLPEPEMREVAKFVGVVESKVYAVATFYEQFKFSPQGRNKIVVCMGTACHLKASQRIMNELERKLYVKPGETTADMEFTYNAVNCVGACALAPVVVINDKYHPSMSVKKINKKLEELDKERINSKE